MSNRTEYMRQYMANRRIQEKQLLESIPAMQEQINTLLQKEESQNHLITRLLREKNDLKQEIALLKIKERDRDKLLDFLKN